MRVEFFVLSENEGGFVAKPAASFCDSPADGMEQDGKEDVWPPITPVM